MKRSRLLLGGLAASGMVLLSACASQKDTMIKQGYPLAYADGFDDGCHSGHKAGGSLFDDFKKDPRRFEAERQYAQGWSDGFRQCESEEQAAQRQARMVLEQQKLSQQREHDALQEQRHLEREVMKGIDTKGLENLK